MVSCEVGGWWGPVSPQYLGFEALGDGGGEEGPLSQGGCVLIE